MATVNLEKMTKVYPNGKPAVLDLDLDVAEGELMVLVGPSGSGKTTALRMVAGLEDITSGTLRMGGKVVNDLAPKDRNVAMVFQSYALYPHMTVAENIGFSLKLRKVPKSEVQAKVKDAAALLGLTDYLDRKPSQLSGGQRQRVAMGRAIVREPSVFLMDEPLVQPGRQDEGPDAGRDIAHPAPGGGGHLLRDPRPDRGHDHGRPGGGAAHGRAPAVRHPPVPLRAPQQPVRGRLHRQPGHEPVRGHRLPRGRRACGSAPSPCPWPRPPLHARPALRGYRDRKVIVGIRPEDLDDPALADPAAGPGTTLVADVELVEALGNELQVHFLVDATKARSEVTAAAARDRGAGRPARLADGRGQGRGGGPHLAPQRLQGRLPGHLRGPHRTAPLLRRRQRPSHLGLSWAGSFRRTARTTARTPFWARSPNWLRQLAKPAGDRDQKLRRHPEKPLPALDSARAYNTCRE